MNLKELYKELVRTEHLIRMHEKDMDERTFHKPTFEMYLSTLAELTEKADTLRADIRLLTQQAARHF